MHCLYFGNISLEYVTEMLKECQASGENVLGKLCSLTLEILCIGCTAQHSSPSYLGLFKHTYKWIKFFKSKNSVPQFRISNVLIAMFP